MVSFLIKLNGDKMDDIYKSKRDVISTKKNNNKFVHNFITRILIATILFFGIVIYSNYYPDKVKQLKDKYLDTNINFSKISNIYNKYLGSVVPIKNIDETKTVFDEELKYDSIELHDNKYVLKVSNNYLVPVLSSGIVVFIGEKEGLGNTVIIQGMDEVDYWYSNIENIDVELYDYVSKGNMLGNVSGDTLYLTFLKDGKYLKYEEVMEKD